MNLILLSITLINPFVFVNTNISSIHNLNDAKRKYIVMIWKLDFLLDLTHSQQLFPCLGTFLSSVNV